MNAYIKLTCSREEDRLKVFWHPTLKHSIKLPWIERSMYELECKLFGYKISLSEHFAFQAYALFVRGNVRFMTKRVLRIPSHSNVTICIKMLNILDTSSYLLIGTMFFRLFSFQFICHGFAMQPIIVLINRLKWLKLNRLTFLAEKCTI